MALPKDLETLVHINKTNAYSFRMTLEYFTRIYQMQSLQFLMQREILVNLGHSREEADRLIVIMREEAEKGASQAAQEILEAARKFADATHRE